MPLRSAPQKPAKKPARRPFLKGVDDTRAELLSAARDVFLEVGPEQFSLREVARRVGVSATAVYRHFENKDALVFAACTQGFQVFSNYLVRSLAAKTALERMLLMSEQYLQFGLENPQDYRFIFMTLADHLERTTDPSLPQDSTFRFLVERVRECMEAGVLAPADAQSVAISIWAHVHGLVSLRLSQHLERLGDDAAFAGLYRSSVERLLRGLR